MNHTASQPLPNVGSFSYSWPTDKPRPRLERINHGHIAAFIETDPELQCSFDFRLPPSNSEQGVAMIDADQMFCNGLLLPLQLVRQEGDEDNDHTLNDPVLLRSLSLDSSQRMISASERHQLARPRPASLNSSPTGLRGSAVVPERSSSVSKGAVFTASKLRLPSFGRCGKLPLPRGLSCKYLRFLVPLYHKMVRCIWRRKAKDAPQHAAAELCNGKVCDLGREDAIRDAILHCKRSL